MDGGSFQGGPRGTTGGRRIAVCAALDYSPESLKASFDYGRFLFDNGRREEGLDVYRRSGWLLDIPFVSGLPPLKTYGWFLFE